MSPISIPKLPGNEPWFGVREVISHGRGLKIWLAQLVVYYTGKFFMLSFVRLGLGRDSHSLLEPSLSMAPNWWQALWFLGFIGSVASGTQIHTNQKASVTGRVCCPDPDILGPQGSHLVILSNVLYRWPVHSSPSKNVFFNQNSAPNSPADQVKWPFHALLTICLMHYLISFLLFSLSTQRALCLHHSLFGFDTNIHFTPPAQFVSKLAKKKKTWKCKTQ